MIVPLLIGLALFVVYVIYLNRGLEKHAPGPICFPLIGSIWALGLSPATKIHLSVDRLAKKWGPIFRLKICNQMMVVISDPEVVRESFGDGINSPILSHFISHTNYRMNKGRSLIFTDDKQHWMFLRKLCTAFNRNVPGGIPISKVIYEEQDKLFAVFDSLSSNHTEVYLNAKFMFFVRNVFLRIMMRESWSFDSVDEVEQGFNDAQNAFLYNLTSFAELVPELEFLVAGSVKKGFAGAKYIDNYINKMVKARERSDPPTSDAPRDFLDVMIIERRVNPSFDEDSMLFTLRDLFLAGTITVSDTLDWMFMFLCDNPDMQEKCYLELNENLQGSLPTMEDQARLPYLESVIKETFRIRPPVPLSIPHVASRDCTIHGYFIEKGTLVSDNLYGICNSEKYFKNPSVFNPDRWRTDASSPSSSLLESSQNLLTFGYGPTICLGMPVAKQEVFLTAARMIQRYKFKFGPSTPNPDFSGEYQVTFNPKEWKTVITLREGAPQLSK